MTVSRILLGVVILGVFTGTVMLIQSGLLPSVTAIEAMIADAGVFAPLIFISMYAILTILFVPGTPLTVLGGVLFGPMYGTLYTVIGATIGAAGAFLLARFFRQQILSTKIATTSNKLAAYDNRLHENGFVTTLILRVIPLFPFNALNYGLGLTRIRFSSYLYATLLGIIPGTFVYVYFGSSVTTLNPVTIGSAVAGIIALTVVGKYLLQRYR